jgi:tRNA A58 N-methylase Trm61
MPVTARRGTWMALVLVWLAVLHADAQAPRTPDVVYVPTPQDVVEAMLELANVTAADVVYDLGSGDGRIPITAAAVYGARGVGIEIDPGMIEVARANAQQQHVADKVRFRNEDLFAADIGEASVVTLYLLRDLNLKLLPKLNKDLKPGTRVVTHAFDMGQAKPRATREVSGRPVYLYVVPIH